MEYLLHIAVLVNIYVILCIAANLVTGITNMISLGYAAFYGIGAYLTALCVLRFHLPIIPSLALIMLINAGCALLVSMPSLRLKGDYFILSTLAFQYIIYTILYNWTDVTQGPFGIAGISAPRLAGSITVKGTMPFFLLSLLMALVVALIFSRLIYSPFGRVLRGIRDNESSLLSLGRNVFYYKNIAFAITAAFCGWASYLYATYITYIDPGSFGLDESIFILCALLIGGTGNIRGPVTGALFVVVLPELIRYLDLPDNYGAALRQILYGITLILVMFFRRRGLAGENKFS